MKSNLLRTFFEWALITSVLMSAGFFFWFYSKSRQVRMYQIQIATAEAGIQQNHAVVGMLLKECQEYAKTNGDMARVLQSLESQPPAQPAAAKKPAAR